MGRKARLATLAAVAVGVATTVGALYWSGRRNVSRGRLLAEAATIYAGDRTEKREGESGG